MITVFNRAELCITYDLNEQYRIRNILVDNGIPYRVKTKNLTSPSAFGTGSRERSGTFGLNMDCIYEYIIYVHKNDYEYASHLIHE